MPSIVWRTIWLSTALGILCMLIAWNLLRYAPRELRAAYWFTAAVLGISGIGHLLRVGVSAGDTARTTFFAPSPLQTATLLGSVAILLLGVAGLVALTMQRLLRDLQLAQDAERAALEATARMPTNAPPTPRRCSMRLPRPTEPCKSVNNSSGSP